MSKSLGNHIPINTDAPDMFGKVMSIPDAAMPTYSRLVTRGLLPISNHGRWSKNRRSPPPGCQDETAREVTASFYGEAEADRRKNPLSVCSKSTIFR
jgi:tyrosyl-tRNA synthetase